MKRIDKKPDLGFSKLKNLFNVIVNNYKGSLKLEAVVIMQIMAWEVKQKALIRQSLPGVQI